MELPQSHSFATQGRKHTHDFLSLYSPANQDPTLTPPGRYLKTYDLLQPLERVGKKNCDEITSVEKPMSNILPGGIGSYSINHISYIDKSQRSSKPEAEQSNSSDRNDENSNCTSYTDNGNGINGFTLWEESAGNKGKTGKENIAGNNRHIIRAREGGMQIGGVPWITSSPSQSSSIHNHPTTNISYRLVNFFLLLLNIFYKVLALFLAAEFNMSMLVKRNCSHSAQKNQSFVDMLKSAKPSQEDENDDDGREFVIKTETSSHRKASVKVEPKPDEKPNILRSKHSATEQRRRSKINDRFSMLRDVIPHGDQKRDKASFLLEVIEYIQFLQEKVHKYENSCSEPPKTIPWNSDQRPTIGFTDQPQVSNGGHEPELHYRKSCATDSSVKWDNKLKEKELMIENGTISISTIYSQGLLSTLTQALQSSGVELSRASISIQIDLGKRTNPNSSTPNFKKTQVGGVDESIERGQEDENDEKTLKRLKRSIN